MGTGVLLYHSELESTSPDISEKREILNPAKSIITQIFPEGFMKIILNIIGILLILAGSVFFLQGINVLPGSIMTGDPQWAINGGIMIVIGVGLILWARRQK
jgi:hypothetical protein